MNEISTATLLVSCTHQDEEEQLAFDSLAATLSSRLNQPVIPFPIDQPIQSLTDILSELMRHGIGRIVTLPLFLSPAEYRRYAVEETVAHANRRWPFVQHHVARPLDWEDWLGLLDQDLRGYATNGAKTPVGLNPCETAVILVGHGDPDPAVNSDLAKLARLFYERHDYRWVDIAFATAPGPTICDLITQHYAFGAKHIIVAPYMLFEGQALQRLLSQVELAQENSQFTIHNSQLTRSICCSPATTPLSTTTACCLQPGTRLRPKSRPHKRLWTGNRPALQPPTRTSTNR